MHAIMVQTYILIYILGLNIAIRIRIQNFDSCRPLGFLDYNIPSSHDDDVAANNVDAINYLLLAVAADGAGLGGFVKDICNSAILC